MFLLESATPDESLGHSRSGSENDCGKTFYSLAKFFLMCLAFLVAYYFQVTADYPLKVDIYETDDPADPKGSVGGYTCGCDVPITDQSLGTVRNREKNSPFNLNVCYDRSQLKNLNIIMYSDSSVDYVKSVEGLSTATKTMDGFLVEQQAHAITGRLNSPIANAPPIVNTAELIGTLYPGGDREFDYGLNITDFDPNTNDRRSFPINYLRLAFTYCSTCRTVGCDLGTVRGNFNSIIGPGDWGDCFVDSTNECDRRIYSYQAKCTLYSTGIFPSFPVVKKFLENFEENPTVHNISAANTFGLWWRSPKQISLQPSVVYVNHSKITPKKVRLHFKHVDPQSASWLVLSSYLPSLKSNCSSLSRTTVCNDSSVCSLIPSADLPKIKCLNQSLLTGLLRNASSCKSVFNQSTLEDAGQLCKDLGVTPIPQEASQCTCMRKQGCQDTFPYLAIWNTSNSVKDDPMNIFLSSHLLQLEWAGRSSPCRNMYDNVIPFNPGKNYTAKEEDYGQETLLLQGDCSGSPGNAWKGMGSSPFCWLTGLYRNFNDTPADGWKPLNNIIPEFRNDSNSPDRFVCYRIRQQRTLVWIILIFGVAFGWAGSVDLFFSLIERFRKVHKEVKQNKETEKLAMSRSRSIPIRRLHSF